MADPTSLLSAEPTLSVGAVVRLTGLSEHVLRAWERRYGAVVPTRTPGGTRRYSEADVRRLRLLRDAIADGSRISDVASLDDAVLERLRDGNATSTPPQPVQGLRETLLALGNFDGDRAKEIVSLQLAALGPSAFARHFVPPLMREIGDAWQRDSLCIASEHLGSAVIRSCLETALRSSASPADGPVILFATPPGENHELGLLVAAVVAQAAGARTLYLGADLPLDEIALAADRAGAQAVALSVVTLPETTARELVKTLRAQLSKDVDLWVGGRGATPAATGVSQLDSLDEFETRVGALREHLARRVG